MIDRFDGTDYHFLSNFAESEIEYEGIKYPTVEHAFQAAKTLSKDKREMIAKLPTPGEAKRAGRRVTLRDDWENIKIPVMEACLRLKFANPGLMGKLVLTSPHELVEGNTWGDKFWGVCEGEGENNLGKLLMKIREEQLV